jgi:ElaB/YqjD/DUF883 family membrane-anchored ribosome-binding protein
MERTEANSGSAEMAARMSQMQEQAQEQLEKARDALADFDVQARAFIRERPGLCLVGAIAAGFVIGRLVSRR